MRDNPAQKPTRNETLQSSKVGQISIFRCSRCDLCSKGIFLPLRHFWISSSSSCEIFSVKILVKAELTACLNDNLVEVSKKKKRHPQISQKLYVRRLRLKSTKIFSDSQTFISAVYLLALLTRYYKLSIKTWRIFTSTDPAANRRWTCRLDFTKERNLVL